MRNILRDLPVGVIPILLMAGLVSGCGSRGGKGDGDKKPKVPEAVPVEVTRITRGPIEATWESSTSLEAEAEVRVVSRAANRVTDLEVEEGSVVRRGDMLLRLESDIQRIAMEKAQSSFDKAQDEFQRQETLYNQGLISRELFTEAKYNLRQLELSLEDAKREFDYTEVRAPIDGTLTRRLVKLGDFVTANQHLFDMVDFQSMVARVYPPERLLSRLQLRQPARVRPLVDTNRVHAAYVKRISPIVEGRFGTVKVTLGFDAVDGLRPGMYVGTEIVLATFERALLIPKRALVYDGDQTFVYRLTDDRKVERLLLDAELADSRNVTPSGGFSEGDEIVIAGQTGLKDGAKVRLPGDPAPEKQGGKDGGKE